MDLRNWNGCKGAAASRDRYRRYAVDFKTVEDRLIGRAGGRAETVGETLAQTLARGGVEIYIDALFHSERDHPQVVDAVRVVGVVVGKEHAVKRHEPGR